jgi:hypothetical protein
VTPGEALAEMLAWFDALDGGLPDFPPLDDVDRWRAALEPPDGWEWATQYERQPVWVSSERTARREAAEYPELTLVRRHGAGRWVEVTD